jgi:predicted aspartyl protease
VKRSIVAALACALLPTTSLRAALADPVSVPYGAIDNRIVLQCRVNGRGPYAFLLDTGASETGISSALARELGLATKSAGTIGGAGSGKTAMSTARLASIVDGGFRALNIPVVVIDLSPVRLGIGFARFDGVLGYDTAFAGRVVEIDADRHVVVFNATPTVPPGARSVPFTYDGLIHVEAAVDGIGGDAVVDTGDRTSLTMFAGFARRNGYYAHARAVRHVLTGFGVGGPIYSDVFRVQRFNAFGFGVTGVVTRASRDRGGVFATGQGLGSIGSGMLRRFNILYDDARRTLTAWPSAAFATRERYDPFGMWISASDDGVRIAAVTVAGAAARAGIVAGTRINSIDGRPVDPLDIPALRDRLRDRHEGSRVTFALRAPGGKRTLVTLVAHERI